MNRNILRGIVVLIVLLGIAGVFLLIDKDTETETVYNPPSEEEWQKIRQDLAAQKAQDAAKAQSPEENREKGHRHADGIWHAEPHKDLPVVQHPSTVYKPNGRFHDIDYSIFEKPEELIKRLGEILLHPEKYPFEVFDRAKQEDMILSAKISNGDYGEDTYQDKFEYREKLRELRNKTYADALLEKNGFSREMFRAMIRGEIPPAIVPIDPSILTDDGGDK